MELMVVISIATIIMTALVIQQSKWNDSLTVSTQAYELALMIRQAQIYSLAVREDVSGTGDKFNIGYGVYFDYSDFTRYIFFADRNGNKKYDASPADEAIETKTFIRGVTIDRICGIKNSGQFEERCSPNGGGLGNVVKASVTFFRPETKASILFLNSGGNPSNNVIAPGKIYLRSAGGKVSSVKVEATGQVSIIQ